MKKKDREHKCEKCKKTFYTKSRYRRFCDECYDEYATNSKELKGGNNQMVKKDKSGKDKGTKKPQINKSNCKKFLAQSGLHVKPDAVDKFKKLLEEYATNLATEIAAKTEARNSKTISVDDVA